MNNTDLTNTILVGWREWLALPELGIPAIRAKVDTGAKSSALHTFDTNREKRQGRDYLQFSVRPLRKRKNLIIRCESLLLDERQVTNSGGHREKRYVIETSMVLGDLRCPIELTLTDREDMRFRMLLGRRAMENRILVDPAASYLCGKLNYKQLYSRG